jgi:hypothetical protein
MKQYDIILKAMLENPSKRVWDERDFQKGKYFVGYEATARISELVKQYPTLFIIGKDGRFRTIEINWDDVETIDFLKDLLEI